MSLMPAVHSYVTHSVVQLLGSNGAGKTTLLRTLCGFMGAPSTFSDRAERSEHLVTGSIELLPPGNTRDNGSLDAPSGDNVDIDGGRRRVIGWCPQMDALYEELSVQEHLQLFADLLNPLKAPYDSPCNHPVGHNGHMDGISSHMHTLARDQHDQQARDRQDQHALQQERDATAALKRLNLLEQRHKPSRALSGGMKRRLSLCLAFAGAPKVRLGRACMHGMGGSYPLERAIYSVGREGHTNLIRVGTSYAY